MQNKVLGNAVLLTFWFIFLVFLTLALFVVMLSLREIIFGFKPGFFPYLYILIAFIILSNAYKFFKVFYPRSAVRTTKLMKGYLKSNKQPLAISVIITAILLYIYYNVFFLKFGFVTNLTLFFPAFVLENLIFIVKAFLKRSIGSLIPEVYEILIPIAEFYYVHSIIGFVYRKAIQRHKKE